MNAPAGHSHSFTIMRLPSNRVFCACGRDMTEADYWRAQGEAEDVRDLALSGQGSQPQESGPGIVKVGTYPAPTGGQAAHNRPPRISADSEGGAS